MTDLRALLGDIDIYLLDQLLRGRIPSGCRVLDAGCGTGRNLRYLLRAGHDVYAADANADSIAAVRKLASTLAPHLPADHFHVEPVEAMTFPDDSMDVVISSAVLHFADGHEQFGAMLSGSWRPLRPGGMFFCRLASTIGMRDRMVLVGNGRFRLPDGTERYLVNEEALSRWTARLDADLLDPLKTTVVQDQRCMTTWVLRKR